jgi:hypothetical protein
MRAVVLFSLRGVLVTYHFDHLIKIANYLNSQVFAPHRARAAWHRDEPPHRARAAWHRDEPVARAAWHRDDPAAPRRVAP